MGYTSPYEGGEKVCRASRFRHEIVLNGGRLTCPWISPAATATEEIERGETAVAESGYPVPPSIG